MQNNIIISAAKIFLVSLSFFASITVPQNVLANPLDDFRNTIKSEHYTIKYEIEKANTENAAKKTEKGNIRNNHFKSNDYFKVLDTKQYFIVCNDKNFYTEVTKKPIITDCYLRIDDKFFEFHKAQNKDKIVYFVFIPNQKQILARKFFSSDKDYNYGDPNMKTAIKALFPNEPKNSNERIYRQVGDGTSNDGLKYYDLKTEPQNEDDTTLNVIRYYFDGNTPVKIAIADYRQAQNGERQGTNCIITIKEFSPVPDQNYLKLPEQLKEIE